MVTLLCNSFGGSVVFVFYTPLFAPLCLLSLMGACLLVTGLGAHIVWLHCHYSEHLGYDNDVASIVRFFSLSGALYLAVSLHLASRLWQQAVLGLVLIGAVCFSLRIGRKVALEEATPKSVSPFGPESYAEYVKGEHWARTRQRALERAGHRCQVCNADTQPLHVHHRTYKRLGREMDCDLTVLCSECHALFHQHRDSLQSGDARL